MVFSYISRVVEKLASLWVLVLKENGSIKKEQRNLWLFPCSDWRGPQPALPIRWHWLGTKGKGDGLPEQDRGLRTLRGHSQKMEEKLTESAEMDFRGKGEHPCKLPVTGGQMSLGRMLPAHSANRSTYELGYIEWALIRDLRVPETQASLHSKAWHLPGSPEYQLYVEKSVIRETKGAGSVGATDWMIKENEVTDYCVHFWNKLWCHLVCRDLVWLLFSLEPPGAVKVQPKPIVLVTIDLRLSQSHVLRLKD